MKVNLFFRKPEGGFRSLEEVFDIVILALENVEVNVLEVPEKRISLKKVWTNLRYARRYKNELNHISGDIHYIALATGRKTVLTIHDAYSALSGSWTQNLLMKIFWFWLPALCAKRITTISEKSRKELVRIAPFFKGKIRVIPNPYNPKLISQRSSIGADLVTNTSKPIVLHIGTKANKNLERTITAMEGLPYKFYIVGQLSEEQAQLLSRHEIDFKSFFNLPYSELATLYHQSSVVSFASLYEGFGMPIIEGQLVGKPVLTSKVDPMPWVAGEDGAHLIDPYNIDEIREGIVKLIEDKSYRKSIIDQGYKNVQRFEPSKVAEMYAEVYREITDS